MNLRALDLNLLVVLHALLEEGHVTRAARRLGLSQPATSSALERCRHVFSDMLLEKVGSRMQLTPKAQALRDPLARALEAVHAVVDVRPRELRELQQVVRLSMADHPAVMLLGALHAELQAGAPRLDLVVLPWRGAADALQRLEGGEADLAVSVFPALPPQFTRVELLREQYVVAMRAGHPGVRRFGLDAWLAYPHVLVSGQAHTRGVLDEALAERGLTRRVGTVVPNFMMVEPLLLASDLVAMLPSRSAAAGSAGKRLAVFDPPLPVPGFALHLAWHARREADPATRHVASLVQRLLPALPVARSRRQRV
ncbi:LysR substrate-binding domain-containing protein [Schlegelella sp. S2-27]|uniref:LysR substrate-binding domain-containing protein n=1 Tax=Caldimonas mangrovi TaxID=2944811 RepID=A0ABT0YSA6_9BURK|nr:LysR family transcriptional regulator [Caldimonas mangrovi]MCM5681214.1 LysR substrate-binding domain-containing protein [Caldimonas mangrovi]